MIEDLIDYLEVLRMTIGGLLDHWNVDTITTKGKGMIDHWAVGEMTTEGLIHNLKVDTRTNKANQRFARPLGKSIQG